MSKFLRIMHRGHSKVGYSERKGRLLMMMSDEQHKHIASVILQWLNQDTNGPAESSVLINAWRNELLHFITNLIRELCEFR